MNKVVISVLGQDRPGIIARVTAAIFEKDGNIENVSQTIVQSEFSGLFIAAFPSNNQTESLQEYFRNQVADMGLKAYVDPLKPGKPVAAVSSQPFVITTQGPDRKGLVAAMTAVIASFNVNVTNLQAVFKGGDDPSRNIMIYEVDVPLDTNKQDLDVALREKAEELGLEISIQHRHIFEAINRI
ncbi:MAG: glycine cleavage system protein R [Thermodesulfobacteriota bacterium]